MRCADMMPLLAARRELAWGQERQVQEHLAACPACLERWNREERALGRMRVVPSPAAGLPAGVDQRVRAALARRGPRPRLAAAPLLLAGALCAALVLLLAGGRPPWARSGPTGQPAVTETATAAPTATRFPTETPAPTATFLSLPPTEAAPGAVTMTVIASPPPPSVTPGTPTFFALPSSDPAATPGRIAFNGASLESFTGSVAVLDPQSGQEILLAAQGRPMDWTPDGRRVLYGACLTELIGPADICRQSELFLVDAAGGERTQLTTTEFAKGRAAISPDGQRLVYSGCIDAECTVEDLWIARLAGVGLEGGSLGRMGLSVSFQANPSWSPGSDALAYYGCDGARECIEHSLYVKPVGKAGARKLADHVIADSPPAWSPDGSRIAFISLRDGQFELVVVSLDGSGERRLTDTPLRELTPAWSPDGQWLAYVGLDETAGSGFESDIYLIPAAGGGTVRLTESPGLDQAPAWSPDGQFIAFVSGRPPGSPLDMRLYLIRRDGTGARVLTSRSSLDPIWAP